MVLITDNRVYGGSVQQEEYEQLLRTHCADFQEKSIPDGTASKVAAFFEGSEVFEDAFVGRQALTLEALIKQTSCMTIAPAESDPRHPPMLQALADYFARWAVDGYVIVPVVCRVACARLRGSGATRAHGKSERSSESRQATPVG